MASSLALKRVIYSRLLNKLAKPIRSASLVSRSFNTNAQMTTHDPNVDVERHPDRSVSRRGDPVPSFFSDVMDPFSPPRSLSQVINLVDQLMENPFMSPSRGMGTGARRGWDVKEDNDALYIRMDMPGLDKENVKISVQQNTLIIRGEGEKEEEEEGGYMRRYSSRLDLPPNFYKGDEIKAEMKNGVLRVKVPKVREEERKDVFQVEVE